MGDGFLRHDEHFQPPDKRPKPLMYHTTLWAQVCPHPNMENVPSWWLIPSYVWVEGGLLWHRQNCDGAWEG
eukprot:11224736-Karenia_brevis.AAC.1